MLDREPFAQTLLDYAADYQWIRGLGSSSRIWPTAVDRAATIGTDASVRSARQIFHQGSERWVVSDESCVDAGQAHHS